MHALRDLREGMPKRHGAPIEHLADADREAQVITRMWTVVADVVLFCCHSGLFTARLENSGRQISSCQLVSLRDVIPGLRASRSVGIGRPADDITGTGLLAKAHSNEDSWAWVRHFVTGAIARASVTIRLLICCEGASIVRSSSPPQ
jgi:hypothetical protein